MLGVSLRSNIAVYSKPLFIPSGLYLVRIVYLSVRFHSNTMKRSRSDHERSVSPPTSKKKVESNLTGKVVANFFAKASDKKPDALRWRVIHDSLMIGKFEPDVEKANSNPKDLPVVKRRKIAAFDFDSTLIKTSSGNAFGRSAEDWQWWHSCVPRKLRGLYEEGYQVVVISNQAGISLKAATKKGSGLKSGTDGKRLTDFKTKVGYVLTRLNLPITIYAATEKDEYRKPRTGMWGQLIDDYDLHGETGNEIDLGESIFIGDAAGRLDEPGGIKADHSCSDRDFAANVGVSFHTPEEYFLHEVPRRFRRTIDPLSLTGSQLASITHDSVESAPLFTKSSNAEIVLLCGSPGAGKSTFYSTILQPLGYERVNQDILKTRDKCLKKASEYLDRHLSVAVDNTNADPDTRKHWIDLAKRHSVSIRVVHLTTPSGICRHNDAVRAAHDSKLVSTQQKSVSKAPITITSGRTEDLAVLFNPEHRTLLPSIAFTSFQTRFVEPRVEEGFEEVIKIPFIFNGSEEARKVWGQYWI